MGEIVVLAPSFYLFRVLRGVRPLSKQLCEQIDILSVLEVAPETIRSPHDISVLGILRVHPPP